MILANRHYKTLDNEFKCGGFQYEIGKTYTKQSQDASGFQYCKSFKHIFDTHPKNNKTTKVVEIQVLGESIPTEVNRFWKETNKILVVREIPFSEVLEVEGLLKFLEEYISEYSTDDIPTTNEKIELLSEELFQMWFKERRVLALRLGCITGKVETLQKIGNLLGITKERARQLEQRAICTLLDNFNLDTADLKNNKDIEKLQLQRIHNKCKK